MMPPRPRSTLFPYTTLFRSRGQADRRPQRPRRPPGAPRRARAGAAFDVGVVRRLRSEEHTSELQSHVNLVCRLLLEKKNIGTSIPATLFITFPAAKNASSMS